MENTRGLKTLRAELGLSQTELAEAIHMSFSSINRWENGKSYPNKGAIALLMDFAKKEGASAACIELLNTEYAFSKTIRKIGETKTVPSELLTQLADESVTSVYVADYETDELLFLNNTAKQVLHVKGEIQMGQKCYEYLMHRDTPCPFCHKSMMTMESFRENIIKFPFNGRQYRISSKIIMWGGRKVHIHYIADVTELLNHEKELRTLTDKIPSGIGTFYVYDDGRIEPDYINDGYYEMLESTRDNRLEYSGFSVLKSIHPTDLPQLLVAARHGITSGTQLNSEVRVRKDDGTYLWVRIRAEVGEREKERCKLYCAFSDVDQLLKTLEQQEQSTIFMNELLEESKASEKKFKSIMEHVPGAMTVFEVKNKMLHLKYISDGCVNITGFTAEETYIRNKKDPLRDAHPDSKEFFLEHEWEDIQKKEKLFYKYQVRCKDRKYKWVSLSLSPVEEDGKILYFGVLRDLDVDERKYQQKEDHYHQMIGIMEQTDDLNLIAKGRYNISKNTLLFYQQKADKALEIPGDTTFDSAREMMVRTASTEKQGEEIRTTLNRAKLLQDFVEGKTKGTIEYKRREAEGAYFWSKLKYYMCLEPEKNDVIFFVYTYDTTKKMLEKSMLGMLGTTEYEVLGTIDIKTHYFETQAVSKRMGIINKKDKLASGNYNEIWNRLIRERVPETEQKKLIQQMQINTIVKQLQENKSYFVTYSVLDSDGTYHRKKIQYCYLDDTRDTLFYYRSDITSTYVREQRQLRDTESALEIARVANSAKTEFFSRMSHDMRTPMNGILGLAGLSLEEQNPEVLRKNMAKIAESGEYLLSLINDTLDFQKIESGKLQLEPKPTYVGAITQNVIDMIKPAAEKKNITFEVINKNTDFNCYVNIDPVRSRQIFVNLLSNAVKFTPEGGSIRVECNCLSRDEDVVHDVFIIRDTGIGMSEGFVKNQLFTPFSQEPSAESLKYAGTGLGLSIVRSLIEMMGGRIEVESELGTGTTFTVYLDFKKIDDTNLFKEKEENKQKKQDILGKLNNKKVLLAEDHPLNAEIAMKLLEKVGCITTWAQNGRECINLFEASEDKEYDIILMDIRMPVVDGLEAAKKIRACDKADAKTIPILAMTANAYEEDVKKSLEAGMNAHLSKPIVPDIMYEKMAVALDEMLR